jgi:UbiD family decarboxylase
VVEIPSDEAPVHQVVLTGDRIDFTRLPFHPQHEFDGSVYCSSAIDYTIDPATGRTNIGCRRLSLRNKTECGTNVTAPSDLKRIYTAAVARGERLPVTFTVGTHPLDFIAATERFPGDELNLIANFRGETAPVVKSITNDIRVPADAEMTFEGYLDERGYCEPEGPYGEYMGCARMSCIRPCCTGRPSCSIRPTAAISTRCAPRSRLGASCAPRCAIRSAPTCVRSAATATICASRSRNRRPAKHGARSWR